MLELKEQRNSTTDLSSGLKQKRGGQEMGNTLRRLREAKKNVFKKLYEANIAILENNISIPSGSCADENGRISVKRFLKQTQCPSRGQLVMRPHWPLVGKP